MKLIVRSFLSLSVAVSLFAAPKALDYNGTWKLDRDASKNLPRAYAQVSGQTITVAQSAQKFSVALNIERTEGSAIQQTFNFDLSGEPAETESTIHTPNGDQKIPMTLKASVRDDGKIEVTEERQLKTPQWTRTMTTYELWDLSADGKTLTIHRKDEMQGGTLQFDMVFTR